MMDKREVSGMNVPLVDSQKTQETEDTHLPFGRIVWEFKQENFEDNNLKNTFPIILCENLENDSKRSEFLY